MQVLMLAGNDDSLLSKQQSNVVVEDFMRVRLIADFLYRLNSSTAYASLHGYDAKPKIKIKSGSSTPLVEGKGFSFVLRKCIVSTKW